MSKELEELKQEYSEGKLEKIKSDLEIFIRSHVEEIRNFVAERGLNQDIGLRWYIVNLRTINTKTENLDQICEIKKEIWYRREENPSIHESAVIRDWAEKHAAGWRDHRVMQIVYTYLQDKEKYLALLECLKQEESLI